MPSPVPSREHSMRKEQRRKGQKEGKEDFCQFLYPIFLIIILSFNIAISYEKMCSF